MAGLRATLGLIPATEKVEKLEEQLKSELDRLESVENSEEYKQYTVLKEEIESDVFIVRKKEIETSAYKDTEEYKTEQEYLQLKKSSSITLYLKTKDSEALKKYETTKDSDLLKQYTELEKYVSSEEFTERKKYLKLSGKAKFQQTPEFQALENFNNLKNNKQLKNYYKFINHAAFNDFTSLSGSEKIKNFEALQAKQGELKQEIKNLKKEEVSESEAFAKLSEYKELSKEQDVKNYYKLAKSSLLSDYEAIKDSDQLEAYNSLKEQVESDKFAEEKNKIFNLIYKTSDEYTKEQEFIKLKNSSEIKHYFKFEKSKELENYKNIHDSQELKKYYELKEAVDSEKFKETKAYYKLSAKKKFELAEEYKKVEAFNALKESDDVQFYLKNAGHKKYDNIKTWELTFSEEFDTKKLSDKWLTKYFWGEALLNDNYALATDKQMFSEKNISIEDSILSITTKSEEVIGKSWDTMHGFLDRNFDYTSGIINTGSVFRQKYGRFEAKIRFNNPGKVSHTFWMLGDQRMPHIDVAKFNNSFSFNNFWKNGDASVHKNVNKLINSKYKSNFYIYTLIWKENSLEWFINGISVAKKTTGVPNEPMYVALSSAIYKDVAPENLPVILDVDWIRCYQFKES